mgnify:CR=1 FL=1
MKLLDTVLHRRMMRIWRRTARTAPAMSLDELRRIRSKGARLSHCLQESLAVAEHRLALPVVGSNAFPRPHGTDWSWRPEVWRLPLPTPGMASVQSKSMLGREVKLFHDCAHSELSLRQVRNTREADLAPYGLRLDVFAFDGSFLSLVIDLPQEATEGLTKRHLIRLDTIAEMEKPLEIFARLNIRHGPNTEQIVRELPLAAQESTVEFDLAYSNLNEKRVERAWIDLIFENPAMSQVTLRDVTFSRRPRAAL